MDDSRLIRYCSTMAQLRRMLQADLISEKEYLHFEDIFAQKYGVPNKSIYRDYYLLCKGIQR